MKKTLSFAVIHFTVAFSAAYLLTGDLLIGSVMAMIEPAINTIAYYFHERVWQRQGQEQNQTRSKHLDMIVCHH
ncbi:DUF2061 domain-containing protein [Photobacterium alginatilyticum]|uniref:DUF2061 domain-containing protein n=1 Tax=Photobacterium alginatilyticum TaxID=1775171 RepID=UPI004067971F